MLRFSALILVLIGFPALAAVETAGGFGGEFIGRGDSVFFKSGHHRPCSQIFVKLAQTPAQIEVRASGYVCDDLQAEVDPFTLTLKDGHLISKEGLDIGTLSETELSIHYVSAEEGFTYNWTLTKTAGGVHYKETWIDGAKPALQVEGDLRSTGN